MQFESLETKLPFTIARSMGSKTLYMTTKDFTISRIAIFKELLISSSAMGRPSTRYSSFQFLYRVFEIHAGVTMIALDTFSKRQFILLSRAILSVFFLFFYCAY